MSEPTAQPPAPSPELKWYEYRTADSKPANDIFAWLFSAAQVFVILGALTSGDAETAWDITGATFILNCIVGHFDERKLKAAGHQPPSGWWAILVPVYLWKRANCLGHRKHYFWLWLGVFVVATMVANSMDDRAALEEAAREIVTEILQEQLGPNVAECKVVRLGDKITEGLYRAKATLANGNDLKITVEEDGRRIKVFIVEE